MSDKTLQHDRAPLLWEGAFRFADELGPAKITHIYEPLPGLKAILVIDNVACGSAIGGIRMAPDVSTEEVFRQRWLASFAISS